jgi:DNA-binding transcriptional LysR family regulator
MDRITSMTAFTTVVTSGSFAAAAKRLNMSPAMVTNHVHALEGRLGARLLNRTTRTLSLTDVGRSYFEQCAHPGSARGGRERIAEDLWADEAGSEVVEIVTWHEIRQRP